MSEALPETSPTGRPDPHGVPKRPMARAGQDMVFATRRQRDRSPAAALLGAAGVDLDVWYSLVDAADTVVEGRAEGLEFDGTAVLRVALSPASIATIRAAFDEDARLAAAVTDRVRRELAGLLGARTPIRPTIELRATSAPDHLRVDAEIEGRLVGVSEPR